ncbi:hypothetical protein HF295_03780 [Hujiaoplasma nucleasis]|uniref:Thioredoxin family protein n=1 Tax=Hujiaoplasma nucleasis TaxID=2725268 RepID=A0A7L6N6A5_9MOLU|nr:hypothetical protein [Hujiaoplasma nucleasis]QLY40024.1 hypothetical protein HF295_03780 [Hujiaoplasma nucleasis]
MKKILTFIMIGLSFFLMACSEQGTEDTSLQETIEYLDYDQFYTYQLFTLEDQLYYNDDVFYIYYYQEGCSACEYIKQDVLGLILLLETDTLLLFDAYNNPRAGIAIEDSFGVSSTPTLVKVSGNNFETKFTSISSILTELSKLD